MNRSLFLPVALQLVGVLVIIAEIIIPSGGLLAILALGIFGYSLYFVFANVSLSFGIGFVLADVILIPVLVYFGIKFMARSPVTLRTRLSKTDGVTSQSPDQNRWMDCAGRALTDLRPSGVAMIDGQRLDVVTRGEYIDKQTPIVVIAVRGNQIIVKQQD